MWDLWGPLIFITLLSCTLCLSSKDKQNVMVSLFSIFWIVLYRINFGLRLYYLYLLFFELNLIFGKLPWNGLCFYCLSIRSSFQISQKTASSLRLEKQNSIEKKCRTFNTYLTPSAGILLRIQ